MKEIHALGSEIIATRNGRTEDGRRTNFDFMSSADSQAVLKMGGGKGFQKLQKHPGEPTIKI